ncbi:DUF2795 domain-containing protein [Pseudonocardia eucalypti]|uniref:DUF2795 domain-containing protein n=1 Tax=Pseudonocardia eucalypti TaxID=648755 RepID=UPI001612C67F
MTSARLSLLFPGCSVPSSDGRSIISWAEFNGAGCDVLDAFHALPAARQYASVEDITAAVTAGERESRRGRPLAGLLLCAMSA